MAGLEGVEFGIEDASMRAWGRTESLVEVRKYLLLLGREVRVLAPAYVDSLRDLVATSCRLRCAFESSGGRLKGPQRASCHGC